MMFEKYPCFRVYESLLWLFLTEGPLEGLFDKGVWEKSLSTFDDL